VLPITQSVQVRASINHKFHPPGRPSQNDFYSGSFLLSVRNELVSTGWQVLRSSPNYVLFQQGRRVPLNENSERAVN
jgi:hypothetical protein